MGFKEAILFMLNRINKSLQVELNKFFEVVLKREDIISKQAFSENRQKRTDIILIKRRRL